MKFRKTNQFQKDEKKLRKKYRTLTKDLENLEKVIEHFPEGRGELHWNCITATDNRNIQVFKVRLACAAIKGKSVLRVVYGYHKETGAVEFVEFIEVYFKGNKENEDHKRVEAYIKSYLKK